MLYEVITGFISYPVEHKKLALREVLEDKLVIIAPPDHPLAHKENLKPKDLTGQNFIMHERESAPRRAIEEFSRKNNLSLQIPLELSRITSYNVCYTKLLRG